MAFDVFRTSHNFRDTFLPINLNKGVIEGINEFAFTIYLGLPVEKRIENLV